MKKYILILLLVVILSVPFLTLLMIVEVTEIPTTVTVGSELGFNVDTDKLYFGTLVRGGSAERSLDIANFDCKKCFVVVSKEGEIAKWITLSDNKFIMRNGEGKSIIVDLNVPNNADEGVYTGNIKIVFWKTI